MNEDKAVLLGTRGSVPVGGKEYMKYGGDSSCVFLRLGGEQLLLDAGSGLLRALPYIRRGAPLHLFLTHPHVDHLLGLPLFPPLFDAAYPVRIYAPESSGRLVREQIEALMAPPLWPAGTEVFSENVVYPDAKFPLQLGRIQIDAIRGNHPGGCAVYKLSQGTKSIVYCTDFEYDPGHGSRLVDFARGCSLLIYDAQYTPREYQGKQGWGHSTWEHGALVGRQCQAKRVVFTHHSPFRTDKELDEMSELTASGYPECSFGRCGEEIYL